jgi:gas vesicle protein
MSNKGTVTRGFGSFLGVFALGATAGAAAALLMAPRSGRDTRAQLKSAALGLKRKMERTPAAMRAAGDPTDQTKNAGTAAYEQVRGGVTRRADTL